MATLLLVLIFMMIFGMAFMIREMALADNVCASCIHYKKCFKSHPEFNKRNTLELPTCEKFKA